jgi:hypothetical protein
MNTKKLQNLKSWTEAEVSNFKRMLEEESESVAREMDDSAKQLRNGKRVYSTDAANMLGRMNRLYELQNDLDAAEKRLELLNMVEGDE